MSDLELSDNEIDMMGEEEYSKPTFTILKGGNTSKNDIEQKLDDDDAEQNDNVSEDEDDNNDIVEDDDKTNMMKMEILYLPIIQLAKKLQKKLQKMYQNYQLLVLIFLLITKKMTLITIQITTMLMMTIICKNLTVKCEKIIY